MGRRRSTPDAEAGATAVEAEIAGLSEYAQGLEVAIGEFEHEARRCRDRLERTGGQSREASRRLARLIANRDHDRQELEKARRRLGELRARLKERESS